MIFNLPNIISLSRVVVAPLFVFLMISGDDGFIILASFLYLMAAISDYIDGWYARKFNLVTKWGKFFDPLADKVLTTACFIVFVIWGIIPWWMIALIFLRDFGTTFLRIMASVLKYKMETSYSAKVKTFVQMLFITAILVLIFIRSTGILNISRPEIDAILKSVWIDFSMLILVLITVWTLGEYIFRNKSLLSMIWSYFTKKKLANE